MHHALPEPTTKLVHGLSQFAGSVEGDLPDLVLASEPAGDGAYDVVVLRREIVRRRMPLTESVHHDDSGQPFAVPVRHEPQHSVRSY